MALLQHYGFRSWFVDITSDPEIAAWFATHKYISGRILVAQGHIHSDPDPSAHLTDRSAAVVSTARYERCDTDGFLFVFQASNDRGSAYSLSETLSPSALRVHRQKGGALIPPLDGLPVSSLLLATFIIDGSIVLPERLNAHWLFPPPSADEVYKKLLRVPYVVNESSLDEEPLLGWPGLIDLPLYIYDVNPEVDSLRHIRVLVGYHGPNLVGDPNRTVVVLPLSSHPKISYATSWELPNESLPTGATNINLRRREFLTKPLNFSVWKARSMFLLYPVQQMLVTFMYRDAVYPLFRGLLVDIAGEHDVRITAVAETMDHLVTGDFNPGDETRFLEDFYFLTERLETGDASLIQKGPDLHYEWKGWEGRHHEDPLAEFRTLYSAWGPVMS